MTNVYRLLTKPSIVSVKYWPRLKLTTTDVRWLYTDVFHNEKMEVKFCFSIDHASF